jgi:hypothetical protein
VSDTLTSLRELHAGVPRLVLPEPIKQYLWDVAVDGKQILAAVPVQSAQAERDGSKAHCQLRLS